MSSYFKKEKVIKMAINRKEICLLLQEELAKRYSSLNMKINTEYTGLAMRTQKKVHYPDLIDRLKEILTDEGYFVFMPTMKQEKRFVAVLGDEFADIETREEYDGEMYDSKIFIYVSDSPVELEWWYEKFIACI